MKQTKACHTSLEHRIGTVLLSLAFNIAQSKQTQITARTDSQNLISEKQPLPLHRSYDTFLGSALLHSTPPERHAEDMDESPNPCASGSILSSSNEKVHACRNVTSKETFPQSSGLL